MQSQELWSKINRVTLGLLLVLLAATDGTAAAPAPGVQSVERLVIRYHGGSYELLSRTTLRKILPPSMLLPDSSGAVSGSWFELQTVAGGVLYRRPMRRPEIRYVEVPKDSTTGEITRQETTVTERTFVITVPLRDDGVQVVFYGQPVGTANKALSSQVMGIIRLR